MKRGITKTIGYLAVAFLPVLLGYMLFTTYREVKTRTIEEFDKLQMILAKQAAKGIEGFFRRCQSDLLAMAKENSVLLLDDQGKELMNSYYGSNSDRITAITRVDASGKIVYTVPYQQNIIGMDIGDQAHFGEVRNTLRPVVSDVFETVQGYKTIAFHVPVIKEDVFCGSLAILIPFDHLVTQYIGSVKIGENGYAWVINERGTEIYCPVPGHIGKSIFETSGDFPEVIAMAQKMMKGVSGVSTYQYDKIRGKQKGVFVKHAVFYPIDLGNTFWSVAVATPEKDVLATMTGFQNRIFFIGTLLIIVAILYSYYFIRTRAVLTEEKKRRSAETALRESVQKYQDVVENAASIILRWDADGVITYLNPFGLTFFGYTAPEIMGKNVVGTIVPQTESSTQRDLSVMISEISKNPEKFKNNMNENIKKNGERIWISWTNKAIRDDMGNIVEVLSIGNDITEKRNLEIRLGRAQRLEAIGTLAGGIAHDFNNLLMGIQGRVSLMTLDGDVNGVQAEHLAGIEECVKSAAGLTRQLLGFARGGKYEVKPTDLNQLIKKNAEMFGRTKKEIVIHSTFKVDLWPVAVDQGQIEQVLMNIFVNAWQAMPGGGDMFVETDNVTLDEAVAESHEVCPGRYVMITLTDTGIGMAPEVQSKIFNPFFTTKERNRGTGLGLASAYGIIKNHNGFIDFYSEKGKGSTFILYLPASDSIRHAEAKQVVSLMNGEETVLLVDDEDMTLDVGQKMLQKLGYKVLIANGGEAALDVIKKNNGNVSLVILDMIMPEMDGGEVFDRLKKIRPDLKVLLSSGYSMDGKAAEIMKRGCHGFIQKPFTMADLSVKIREVIDSAGV